MPDSSRYTLFGRPGWGSVIIEAQLAFLGLEAELREVGDLFETPAARASLLPYNPLAQLPTLILPGGAVMTESAAMTLYLADVTGSDALVPLPGAGERAEFLRWLVFIVANIYPTYTFADDPGRFVADVQAREGFRQSVDEYARRLYQILGAAAKTPWFLGARFSALDIYITTLTQWRPGFAWFAGHAPALHGIALKTQQIPVLKPVWARNFGVQN